VHAVYPKASNGSGCHQQATLPRTRTRQRQLDGSPGTRLCAANPAHAWTWSAGLRLSDRPTFLSPGFAENNKRAVTKRSGTVNRSRQCSLTRAALAEDQHQMRAIGRHGNHATGLLHHAGLANVPTESSACF
jgi:hypothetical protein